MVTVRQPDATEARRYIRPLADVLLDCVAGGASVSFMADLTRPAAEAFFEKCVDGVERGERILLVAFGDAEVVGTVQVITATPPNQPHRADIAKLLVRRSARGKGIGTLLMETAEEASRNAGKSLLVLDTVSGEGGERLYSRMGWTKAGIIPNYALFPDGSWCDTTIFWKSLL